jgi:LysR family glycine cleavage system transcriptional activator
VAAGEVTRGDLVPLTPTLPVVEFPAYWVVCPARHMKRRGVTSFLRWVYEQADLHKITTSSIMEQHDLSIDVLQSPADELGEQGAGTT